MHAFSVIYKQRGFRGLWKGWAPNVQRAALVNMGGQYSTIHNWSESGLRQTECDGIVC